MSLLIGPLQGCYGLYPTNLGIHLSGSWASLPAISLMRFTHSLDRNRRCSVEQKSSLRMNTGYWHPNKTGYTGKKETKQKQRKSIWNICDMTVELNRINNKYSSWAYSPSLESQNWKEYDQKSHAFLCCTIQVKDFSFRRLNEDHLFGRNYAKIPKHLLQEETRLIKSKSLLWSNTQTATNTVLPEHKQWRGCGIFCS